jgi:hypothetical protein
VYGERLKAKARGDMVTSEIEKIFMNSLFGKMLQDDARFTNVSFAFNDADLLHLVDDENELVTGFSCLPSGDVARLTSKFVGPIKKRDMYLRTMAPVGVAILAWARLYMAMFTDDLQRAVPDVRLLYTDTDSIYAAFPTAESWRQTEALQERYMGKTKLMHFKPEAEEHAIVSFCATTPKCYSLQVRAESWSEERPEYVGQHKVKGVSQRYNAHLITFDAYVAQVFDEDAPPLVGSAFNINQRQPLQLYSQRVPKTILTNRLTKRAWLEDSPIQTYPHGHRALQ